MMGGGSVKRPAYHVGRGAKTLPLGKRKRRKTQFRSNIGREPTLPPWRRAALPEPEPGGAEPGNPSPPINDITSRPDQHGGSSHQPPGTAQQAVGATIPRIYDPRACSCNFMFGYPASANRLFAASVFRRLPSGSVASRSPRCTDIYVSCCGNILWFEKCNTSEYAAGGHRPTRSDAAKQNDNENDFTLAMQATKWNQKVVYICTRPDVCDSFPERAMM
ncbi:unnamed protein product, partial [Nesidiocoris tenuis]